MCKLVLTSNQRVLYIISYILAKRSIVDTSYIHLNAATMRESPEFPLWE